MLTSCCGMRLNTAGMVIGWLGSVGSSLLVVLGSIALSNAKEIAKFVVEQANANFNLDEATATQIITVGLAIYLVSICINLLTSIMLILGTVKERHLLILPWLINAGSALVLGALSFIICSGILIWSGLNTNSTFLIMFNGLHLAFQFYIWLAVYSLFKKLQAQRDHTLLPSTTVASSYPSYTKM